jgi:hypothetical protein
MTGIVGSFSVRVNGRSMRVRPVRESFRSCDDDWTPVDCRDVWTGMESQAIVLTKSAGSRAALVAEDQVRDALRSAYINGVSQELGRYPAAGDARLPEDFKIEVVG